ncbi:MAG: aminomethyl-transferring glycine dehydrogenase subunit GcvPB [Bacteroidales bacterium]|jgi:glycine dehydrogenase subunit 2|nr:aminomethyl-transferring glycine dehydrogenase subunit GcvPB [Bacteroidales bacterium]
MKYYDKLIFELSKKGRIGFSLPECKEGETSDSIPGNLKRQSPPDLPQVSEPDVVRHYTNLSQMNFGVDTGFYPLGSCTMKYNPKINEEIANMPGFQALHPLQPDSSVQGALSVYYGLDKALSAITGMEHFTFGPCAGAHGELTGLMIMRKYHFLRGDMKRTKVIVPDSAHGTNPASAVSCGLDVVVVKSDAEGLVDVDSLKPLLDDTVAGIMMTNPNTLGLFEKNIKEIAALVHGCGGLLYYDGANLNPLLGVARPGDMGFDIMHVNLHKTFSTPHGGGGPGAGPVGVSKELVDCLPVPRVVRNDDGTYGIIRSDKNSAGTVSGFMGNFGILLRAYAYILMLGKQNVKSAGRLAVLNANYIKESLKDCYKLPITGLCKHEFVFDGLIDDGSRDATPDSEEIKGVTTLDVAKRLLDYGFHAPTIYFPMLFHQSIMIEPTETESKETIDSFITAMKKIAEEAKNDPDSLRKAPHLTPIKRPDETAAARNPVLTFMDEKNAVRI